MGENIDKLYFGDNIEIMEDFSDNSIDLIYADPPFFTQRDWGDFDDRFDNIQSYLQWLRPRLERCWDVLKDTGSIYLHLDWHAVHYVKVVMDDIFGIDNFQNDISWHYNRWTNTSSRFQRMHDTILFYIKTKEHVFNTQYQLTPHLQSVYDRGFDSNKISGKTRQLIVYDRVKASKEIKKTKYDKIVYRESKEGVAMNDVWNINHLSSNANERLGYPTQKPEALLERIIKASSNPGDVIFDPFCGCGTTLAVAQKFGRRWIGIDFSENAIKLTRTRLENIKKNRQSWM